MKLGSLLLATTLPLAALACQQAAADGVSAAAVSVVIEPGVCGEKGQADCPTQRWMKATLQSYLRSGDFERLATALDSVAAKQPADYDGWTEFAKQGAAAAREHDERRVRQSCKGCHDEFRDRFKSTLRHQVLFGS